LDPCPLYSKYYPHGFSHLLLRLFSRAPLTSVLEFKVEKAAKGGKKNHYLRRLSSRGRRFSYWCRLASASRFRTRFFVRGRHRGGVIPSSVNKIFASGARGKRGKNWTGTLNRFQKKKDKGQRKISLNCSPSFLTGVPKPRRKHQLSTLLEVRTPEKREAWKTHPKKQKGDNLPNLLNGKTVNPPRRGKNTLVVQRDGQKGKGKVTRKSASGKARCHIGWVLENGQKIPRNALARSRLSRRL